ncbi:MAG: hypothetical protein WA666_11570 [Nitrospirota bacterium]
MGAMGALVANPGESIRYCKVVISAAGISQAEGEIVLKALKRSQISRIELGYEANAKYPFFQYILGFTLLLLGLLGLLIALLVAIVGGSINVPSILNHRHSLPLIPINLWVMVGIGFLLLSGIFRGRYLLLVDTGGETHKIYFKRGAQIGEIQKFIKKAQTIFGYEIDISALQEH